MLNNFLNLYKPINIVMQNSNYKAFKDKKLLVTEEEVIYLRNTLRVLKIFIKATNKLQADKYPTIYYTIPYIYKIYTDLEKIRDELKVSSLIILLFYNILTYIIRIFRLLKTLLI